MTAKEFEGVDCSLTPHRPWIEEYSQTSAARARTEERRVKTPRLDFRSAGRHEDRLDNRPWSDRRSAGSDHCVRGTTRKPVGLFVPAFVSRDAMRFEASGYHGLSFHRLLIEAGTLTAAFIKAVGADGNKMASARVGALQIGQPTERLQSGFSHIVIRDPLSAHQQGMGQHGVAVGQRFFVPAPFRCTVDFDTAPSTARPILRAPGWLCGPRQTAVDNRGCR